MALRTELRSNDLRNITVMEVIIAVTLILMLIIYFKDATLLDQEKLNKDKFDKLNNKIALLDKENSKLEIENRKLRVEKKDLQSEVDRLMESIEPNASGIRDLKEFIKNKEKDLKNKILELEETNSSLQKKLKSLQKKLKVADKNTLIIKTLNSTISKLRSENQILSAELNELKRLSKLKPKRKNQKKAGGVGEPRCLLAGKEIEWLADVRKKGNHFKFDLAVEGPTRDQLIKEVPGVLVLANSSLLSKQKFKKAANKIYKWGYKQKIPCRFYVKIHKKEMSLDDSLFIQHFFYPKHISE